MASLTRVQIYTMQSAAEAAAVAALGVDHVGVTPSHRGLPGEVDDATAADICAALRGRATSVALSVETDAETVERMVAIVQPDILHLCGPPGELGPAAVADLRRALPGVGMMQAIAVTGPEAIATAQSYEDVADFLILDSVTPDVPGVGAAGTVHDWAVSAAIVSAVDVPVVLAGGLSPDNVADAIEAVHPWGVDSLTCTNRPLPSGGFRKDLDLVERFCRSARGEGAS
mgnify:FL=1